MGVVNCTTVRFKCVNFIVCILYPNKDVKTNPWHQKWEQWLSLGSGMIGMDPKGLSGYWWCSFWSWNRSHGHVHFVCISGSTQFNLCCSRVKLVLHCITPRQKQTNSSQNKESFGQWTLIILVVRLFHQWIRKSVHEKPICSKDQDRSHVSQLAHVTREKCRPSDLEGPPCIVSRENYLRKLSFD